MKTRFSPVSNLPLLLILFSTLIFLPRADAQVSTGSRNVPGPVVYASHVIDDNNAGASRGDGDGMAESGERIELSVSLTNQGSTTATGVTATLSTSDPDVTIFDDVNFWPDVAPGTTVNNSGNFGFDVDSSLFQDKSATFTIEVSASNGGPWTSTFDVDLFGTAPPPFPDTIYSGPPNAPVRYDISSAQDGSMFVDVSNTDEIIELEFHFLDYNDVMDPNSFIRAWLSNDDQPINEAKSRTENGAFAFHDLSFYDENCQRIGGVLNAFHTFASNAAGYLTVTMRLKTCTAVSVIIVPIPERIGFDAGILTSNGPLSFTFPGSAVFCDPQTWPSFVLAPTNTLPNLSARDVWAPAGPYIPGDSIGLAVTMLNDQCASITQDIEVDLFLSTDSLQPDTNLLLGSFTVAGLEPDIIPGRTFSASGTIPANLPAGSYYLWASLDPDDLIVESDESDNLVVSNSTIQVQLTPPVPELIADSVYLRTGINAGPIITLPVAGQQYVMHLDWRNLSSDPANGFTIDFRLNGESACQRFNVNAAGNSSNTTACSATPITWPGGSNVIAAFLDAGEAFAEGQENDNSANRFFEYALFDDFELTVQVRSTEDFAQNPGADICIVYGFQDEHHYYYAMLNRTVDESRIYRIDSGQRLEIGTLGQFIIPDNDFHEMKVQRTGSVVEVYFDGALLGTANDTNFGAGGLGLGSFNNAAAFDEVCIKTNSTCVIFEDFESDSAANWIALNDSSWSVVNDGGDLAYTINTSGYQNLFEFRLGEYSLLGQSGPLAAIDFGLEGLHDGSVAWGDYDNDGDLDFLVTGLTSTNQVTRIYQNLDGQSFVDLQAGLPGVSISQAKWGDYDNDGDLDILLMGFSASLGRISKVFRNDNGAFVDINASIVQVSIGDIDWGDYDNDGDLDFVISGYIDISDFVTKIYRNDPDGSGSPTGLFVDSGHALPPLGRGVSIWGDYDNDGDLDLLLAGQRSDVAEADQSGVSSYAAIFRNDPGSGQAGRSFTDINAPLTPVAFSAAAWIDYDNDNDLDILISGSSLAQPSTRLYRNDCCQQFTPVATALANVSSPFINWGDYDNDGRVDLLLNGSDSTGTRVTKLYHNDGSDRFSEAPMLLPGLVSGDAAWGDFDNDRKLDFVLTGSQGFARMIRVYRNRSATPNPPPNAPSLANVTISDEEVILSWTSNGDVPQGAGGLSSNLRVGTTPGGSEIVAPMADGNTGYRRLSQIGNAQMNYSWPLRNLPEGTYYWSVQQIDHGFAGSAFAPEDSFAIKKPFTAIAAGLPNAGFNDAAWGDYDNDNDFDLLLAGGNSTKLYRNDNGVFTATADSFQTLIFGGAEWGDYDNDNDLDLLLTGQANLAAHTSLYRNNNGSFAEVNAGLPELIGTAAWGDYDNDGDLDLLMAGDTSFNNPATITDVFRNDNGSFAAINAGLEILCCNAGDWGDYDSDGDLDILMNGGPFFDAKTFVYRNDGNGIFVDINASLIGTNNVAEWGDYDSDGDLDVLLTGDLDDHNATSIIYRNDNGSFVPADGLIAVFNGHAQWGDYDNDGDLDVLLTGDSDDFGFIPVTKVYENRTATREGFVDLGAALTNVVGPVAWGDYDNDGDLDFILSGNTGTQAVTKIFRNDFAPLNNLPSAPSLKAPNFINSSVILSWNEAVDDETPILGLTYNLRLGTTPGGSEIVSPMAAGTGYRRIVDRGNVDQNAGWMIDNLGEGTYYWSVQAVDNAFAGSAFAPEQSFGFALCHNNGDVNNDSLLTPGDALCAFEIFLNGGALAPGCDEPDFECELVAADANCDTVVTPGDALAIFERFLSNLPPQDCFAQQSLAKASQPARVRITQQTSATNDTLRLVLAVQNPDALAAFGIEMSFPENELALLGMKRSKHTAHWRQLEARTQNASKVLIGGMNEEALSASGEIALCELHFQLTGESPTPDNFKITRRFDEFKNAEVELVTEAAGEPLPKEFALAQAYPNPFNPSTKISFSLPKEVHVELKIYNVLGQEVAVLVDDLRPPGRHEVTFDAALLPSGVYFYRLETGRLTLRRKMSFAK